MRETCALRHLSINTEKTYTHWLGRYGLFLKGKFAEPMTTEQKIETFLTRLAISGMSGSTQNQAFNALLFFYRDVLKQELGLVNSLRAKQSAHVRQCPTQEEVRQLLATVSDIYRYARGTFQVLCLELQMQTQRAKSHAP
jgi:site-specific recombinase XerD